MSRSDEPYHAPDRPAESRLWKGIGVVAVIILIAAAIWWAIGLAGDAAERDPDEPRLEPLEPARVIPPPIFPEPDPVIRAA
ncbi:MAG: hypothetical protein R3326_06295 [Gemmatimonadota bacterium]|nr:hypothetical protein [Gemmatimonadota bacterium]